MNRERAARSRDGKRRLPLVREPELVEAEDADRPPWHWSAIGVVAIFCAWLPLAALVNTWLRRALDPEQASASEGQRVAMIVANALAFVLASFVGGLLVGRYGVSAGKREATMSGVLTAVVAWMLAALSGARSGALVWALLLGVMALLGALGARLGGALGLRLRASVNRRA